MTATLAPLLLKLLLAPGLVAAATYVARHLGHRAAGLIGGLPVVAGPVLLIYAVEHGEQFAQTAAASTVLGLISSVTFGVVYAGTARRASPWVALTAASLAFAAATSTLSRFDLPLAVSALATLAAVCGGSWLIGRFALAAPKRTAAGDLLVWRLLVTAALVVALTAAAGSLSAHLAGLLVPLPIITGVMAGFTHARSGPSAVIELLGGLVLSLACALSFFVTLAAILVSVPAWAAFAVASAAALACWAALAFGTFALERSRKTTEAAPV